MVSDSSLCHSEGRVKSASVSHDVENVSSVVVLVMSGRSHEFVTLSYDRRYVVHGVIQIALEYARSPLDVLD
eukprot:16267053-Heterocapsa_arctica.AAC.1